MWLGSGQQLAKVDTDEVSLLASRVHVLDAVRKLGVIFDSQLSMSSQVSAMCSTGYYQLRQLHPLVRCLSEDAAKILSDPGFRQYSAGLLQLAVLRQSSWFDEPPAVSSVRRRTSHHRSHIIPALCQLRWLPVRRRVDFKISTFLYRSLAGTAPVYLADESTLVTAAGDRPVPSADNRTCLVKRSRNQFGDRCFATAGPMPWNSLPEGKSQISTPQEAKTPEPILTKLGMVDYVWDPTPRDNFGVGSTTWVVWANM